MQHRLFEKWVLSAVTAMLSAGLVAHADHAYYQIVINPAGAQVSLDRGYGILTDGVNRLWLPDADIATHIAPDGWQLELRIPVRAPGDPRHDPLRGVVGRPPSPDHPWYFNLCRQRIRPDAVEVSAFSPTGGAGFHNVGAFGKLVLLLHKLRPAEPRE